MLWFMLLWFMLFYSCYSPCSPCGRVLQGADQQAAGEGGGEGVLPAVPRAAGWRILHPAVDTPPSSVLHPPSTLRPSQAFSGYTPPTLVFFMCTST